MKSLAPGYLRALSFNAAHAATLKKIGEFQGRQNLYTQQTPELLESLQRVAKIESSECSNRLEGIVAPHERIEALVEHKTMPRSRPEQEIAGYRDALNLIHESAENMPFSENIILQLHATTCRFMPAPGGRWKTNNNEIVERNDDGSVRHIRFKPVTALHTPEAMKRLVACYREEYEKTEPLVVVPLAILDFLCIHPFMDGNGRVSRLLTNLLLYHHGFQVGRYVSLERVIEKSSKSYYDSLQAASQGWHEGRHDVRPWLEYFWGVLLAAYGEFEERVGAIKSGRGSKTEQIRAAVERRINPFAISDIERDCPGISRDMVRIVLRKLKAEKAIVAVGKGRGAKWLRKRD